VIFILFPLCCVAVHPSTASRSDALNKQHGCHCEASVPKQSRCERKPVRHEIATAALLPPRDDRLGCFALTSLIEPHAELAEELPYQLVVGFQTNHDDSRIYRWQFGH
jgi:hypothetical protein